MAKRARTERREAEREAKKLAAARMKLALVEAGGSPARPIEVSSASVIEPHATTLPCAACGARGVRLEEHAAEQGLRVTRVLCQRCGARREIWFRIGTTPPS
jgi:hypothetical protein